jgi:hypothetical protein
MKTDDLISLLARQAQPVDRRAPARRFGFALLCGLASATVLMAVFLGVRPDLRQVIPMPIFWLRLGFAVAVGAGALVVTLRLSRPGVRVGAGWMGLSLPIAAAWIASAVIVLGAPADDRLPLILGHTWKICSTIIAVLSLPSFAAMLWAVRSMAPVRLRLAGASAGMLAGATAAVAYCLHCPEMAPPFWSVWYLLGMLAPAALGALLGPRVLRW